MGVVISTSALFIWEFIMLVRSKKILLIAICFFITKQGINAQATISVSGSWSLTIDASDLQAGAGSDLISSYKSVANAVQIDISNAKKIYWRVDIKKVNSNWHNSFKLYIRRTSDGTGVRKSWVSGGTSFQEITDTDQSYFNGYHNRNNIANRLKLDNVSIQIPPDTYLTTVCYTVIQTD